MVASQQPLPSLHVRQLRQELQLSRERTGRVLDVSSNTVARWEGFNRLPLSDRQRHELAVLQEIVTLGRTVYTPEGFTQFLRAPLPAFDGHTALQMMEQGRMEAALGALAAKIMRAPASMWRSMACLSPGRASPSAIFLPIRRLVCWIFASRVVATVIAGTSSSSWNR